jgi:hypothetical protein
MAEIQCRQVPLDKDIATAYHNKALTTLTRIQNHFLQAWAERVAQNIADLDEAFHIPPTAPNLSLPAYEQKLRLWLLRRALKRVGTNRRGRVDRTDIAQLLGVKRQTVEQWVREWEDDKNGKRELLGVVHPHVLQTLFAVFGIEDQ